MLEVKEAYQGQVSGVGKGVALIHTMLSFPGIRPKIEEPYQVCVRIEEETRDRLEKFCKEREIKLIGVAGLILNAAINEFLDYDESLKAFEIERLEAEEKMREAEKKADEVRLKKRAGKKDKSEYVELKD